MNTEDHRPQSSTAFTGGRILTMDSSVGSPETLVVDGDRIAFVGERAGLEAYPDANVVDLAGRTLAPGLIDAHNHLSIAALHPSWRDVSDIADRDALVAAIREQASAFEDGWVRCHGWDETRHGFSPTRHDLDAAGLDQPVILAHSTLHQCVVSSAGLDALGIGIETGDPPGGEIHRAADGAPDGLLIERAWSNAHARSLETYSDPEFWAAHIAVRARALLADGITCVHDAACSPAAESVYRAMARDGTLPISVLALPHSAAILDNELGSRLDGPPTGEGSEWFRVGPVKLFADGGVNIALDTTIHGHPVQYGTVFTDLDVHTRAAVERGFRIAVHAIGNLGVDAALDAFSSVAKRDRPGGHRFRIEHAGVTSPEHWRRLAALGVVAVVQPGFVEHIGERSAGVRFDHHHWLAFGGLAEAGVVLAASSDDPCAPVSPLWGAAKGASRQTASGLSFEPEQAVPFDDWLTAYTRGAAFAGAQENERGSLVAGKRADLVVLDRHAGDNPNDLNVSETWVAGRRVHSADE
jgi:predicted amidohydrolase YtcJ